MRGLPPVYEERNDTARRSLWRNRKPPRQQNAVGTPATPELYLPQVETMLLSFFYDSFEVRPFRGPGHQPRRSQLVDPETSRAHGLWLAWIRSNDLEVHPIAQTDQCVASAPARVLPSRDRFDAEEFF